MEPLRGSVPAEAAFMLEIMESFRGNFPVATQVPAIMEPLRDSLPDSVHLLLAFIEPLHDKNPARISLMLLCMNINVE
jgi:hypothetical protein